ncbi:MAG: recombinase XerC, partial [Rhodospirillaceae bacterium]
MDAAARALIPPLHFPADPTLEGLIGDWLLWLGHERRAGGHTLAAYGRDLAAFLVFIADHQGQTPDTALLARLSTGDFRAYLANRTAEGL